MTERQRFPNAPESVAGARRFALRTLRDLPPDAIEPVRLMVSELATNCIRHTGTGFEISITRTPEEVRVEATDQAEGEPELRSPAPTDPHGRGLLIVDALSADWGVRQRPGNGKTVWFTVELDAPSEQLAGRT